MKIKIIARLSGLCIILSVVFAILKVVGVIDWSWFFCLLPFLFSLTLTITTAVILVLVMKKNVGGLDINGLNSIINDTDKGKEE